MVRHYRRIYEGILFRLRIRSRKMRHSTRTLSRFALLVLLALSALQLPNWAAAQTKVPAEIKINPQIFDTYVGQYQMAEDHDFIFSFFREGERYYIQATDQPKVEMFPAS